MIEVTDQMVPGSRIYLAARYSRRLELCDYREQLRAAGHDVQAHWLDGGHQISDGGAPIGDQGEALVEGDDGSSSRCAAALRRKFAEDDVQDVLRADILISFSEPPRSGHSRGGRHVEFGIALGVQMVCSEIGTRAFWPKHLIVVGHRENLFHWFSTVHFYPTWPEALAVLQASSVTMRSA